jgi:hypothetical protein
MKWTNAMDSKLLSRVANGVAIRAAAREMGVSENAAIARHSRLRGVIFKSDRERRAEEKRVTAKARQRRDQLEATLIAEMLASISAGADRNKAIVKARRAGVRLRIIAEQFGVCRERVRQIEAAA